MIRTSHRWLPLCFCLFSSALWAQSRHELKLGSASGATGGMVELPLSLSTTDEVQGVVAVFEWDGAVGAGSDLSPADGPGEALDGADTVVRVTENDHMILGIVMDSNPEDGAEILPPGDDVRLATVVIECLPVPGETTSPVSFVDGTHSTVEGGPPLDNIVVVGGLSIGVQEGLILTAGKFTCETSKESLTIESATSDGLCGDVRILMNNGREVEGFVTAVCHDDAALRLNAITLGQAALNADFSAVEIDPLVGGTLGVVMAIEDPLGPMIPPGIDQHVATYSYCCEVPPPPEETACFALKFCDGVLGNPPKENLLVIQGLSIGASEGLVLEGGKFCCTGAVIEPPLCDPNDPDCSPVFLCGGRDLSVDANENDVPDVSGSRGEAVEVCFYLKVLEDDAVGHAQLDHIQGFSMAVEYCCDLTCIEELDISGTILEALGAEFVSIQCDNVCPGENPDPGPAELADDGRELIIGVLLDATPPFDGATIPPAPDPQRVGCVTFVVGEDVACDEKCAIEFVDGVDGRGRVPVKNLVSAENFSRGPALAPCEVCFRERERFHRGDCNFSLMGTMAVDIADAASVVSFLFLPGSWQFQPGCLDACDCNDDGRVDLADVTCILQFLFQFGRFPPSPGPGFDEFTREAVPPGPDPTDDKLDCEVGSACELVAQ